MASGAFIAAVASAHASRGPGLLGHMRSLPGAVLIVDGNNVRGADCFGTSQQELSVAMASWASDQKLPCILVLDHGNQQCAWRTQPHAVVTFAGPGQTADDLIVRDSLWLRSKHQRPVLVVTSDAGLIARTKQYRSASCPGVQMLSSATFAKMLLSDQASESSAQDIKAPYKVQRSALDRDADRARRRETTAMREVAAAALSELLRHESIDQAASMIPEGSVKSVASHVAAENSDELSGPRPSLNAVEATDEPDQAAKGTHDASSLLDAYVHWVNELAPQGRRHADPVGLVPSPSMKRRLRRKRHRATSV